MERRGAPPVAAFFEGDAALEAGAVLALGPDAAHHARVRRLEAGSPVEVLDGAGRRAQGTLVDLSRAAARVSISTVALEEPASPVHLLIPVADRERMLWLAEKAAELEATSWRPVVWRRSRDVRPRGEGAVFQHKVRRRMIAAVEQSRAAWLPLLFPDATVERAVSAAPAGTRVLLDRAGRAMAELPLSPPIALAIGPEGGLESGERALLIETGFIPARLARATLRFETAAVAALAIARAHLSRADGDRSDV